MKKRYRYITSGIVEATDKVSDYRLIGINQVYGMSDFIRIEIPDDLKLEKWSCDCYSTTEDERTVADFNPTVMIRVNGEVRADRELTKMFLNGELDDERISNIMINRGYRHVLRFGYITKAQMKWWSDNHEKNWQFFKIPKDRDNVKFYSEEYITEHFKKYLDIIKGIINNNEEYKKTFKEYSNTKLMDIYGNVCLMHCCDTKLDDSDGIRHFIKEELDDNVRWNRFMNEHKVEKG